MRQGSGHIEFENVGQPDDFSPHDPASAYQLAPDLHADSGGGLPRIVAVAAMAPEVMEQQETLPALGNPELPVFAYKEQITNAVMNNPVTIVVGETGSGKSTQIPQMLVEHGFDKVVLSQPRRMAARNVSERIQSEFEAVLGEDRAKGMVGYQTAEASTITDDAKVEVITDGIQLLKLLNEPPKDGLKRVYVVDELHEWNLNMEIAVALIKNRVAKDSNARFVLTSATMDAHSLSSYFSEVTEQPAPVIEVPGRMYPVERIEKPNSTALDEIMKSATENPGKDILVFLGGKGEIADTKDALLRWLPDSVRRNSTILPLHAKMSAEEQDRVNLEVNGTKITLSTDVAQTSLTIDGTEVVIDTGVARRTYLDEEGSGGLRLQTISQADCDQRAGRTGRTAPGTYILTRYDADSEYVPYARRPKYPVPEILRTDMDRAVLRTVGVGIDITELDFFHDQKPQEKVQVHESIDRAKRSLYNLGALDEYGYITDLGRKMDMYPVRPTSARMLMEAMPFSERVRAQLSAVAACIEAGGLPYYAPEVGKAWQSLTDETSSDLLAQLDIFIAAEDKDDKQLTELNLDVQAVHKARELYGKLMKRGKVGDVVLDTPTQTEREQLEQAICAGMVDFVYKHVGGGEYRRISGGDETVTREKSRRSFVKGHPAWVLASPYNIQRKKGGEWLEQPIVEYLTELRDPRILGKVAAEHLVSWRPVETAYRDSTFKLVVQKVFGGMVKLGETKEVDAERTPEHIAAFRESLFHAGGSAQTELQGIKRTLTRLQRLTQETVTQLSQEELDGLIDEAIARSIEYTPALNQEVVDNTLRTIMDKRGITLDSFISPQERERIILNAPGEIVVASSGQRLQLAYSRGIPYVTKFDSDKLEQLPERVFLPDGREVHFKHGKNAILPLPRLRTVLTAVYA